MGRKTQPKPLLLANPRFSPHFLLPFSQNGFAHQMSPKTTFLVFISLKSIRPCLAFNPFKCKAMFGLHTHSYSSFSPFWSLNHLFS